MKKVLLAATRARRGPEREPAGGVRANGGDTGRGGAGDHEPDDQDRRDVPAQRPRLVSTPRFRAGWRRTSGTSTRGRDKDGKRGIYGRQIVWKYYDDAYNPAQTVQLTNKLDPRGQGVRHRGLARNRAEPRDPAAAEPRKVPQVLVSTGASYWGAQYKQFPWTTGWQTDYIAEGRMYAQWILAERARREDRDLLPERRLREGLSARAQAGARLEGEPDRLRAQLRAH